MEHELHPVPNEPEPEEFENAVLARLDAIEELLNQLLAKRAGAAAPKQDELREKILRFMRQYPLEFTALNIAKNIHEPNTIVGSRLQSLANQGLVVKTKEDGQTASFRISEKGLQL